MGQLKWDKRAAVELMSVIVMCAYIVLALVLGFTIPRLNVGSNSALLSTIGKDQIIAFLSSVSSGMMAFTGIVFSLLFVLLQFGSTAYTPRIVNILGRNRVIYHAGGVFTGTFLYTLMALRGVGSVGQGETGRLTLWIAFAWLIASVVLLILLVETLTALTHTRVLYLLSDTGHKQIEWVYGPPAEAGGVDGVDAETKEEALEPTSQVIVYRGAPRYVLEFDIERLVWLARASRGVIQVPLALGDCVIAKASLALVHGSGPTAPEDAVRDSIRLGRDRALEHDPKYAMRLLVDIAVHALSPGINDPTTAVQALDHIEGLLVTLGNARLDIGRVRDASGDLRLVYEATTWEDYLDLGLAEIQRYGADAVQVERRLGALFSFLAGHIPSSRRPAVERLAAQHGTVVRGAFAGDGPRMQAELGDRQGLGHTHRVAS